jgi:DNA-binding HxlR family transcriptional regulator
MSGAWTANILWYLGHQPRRFGEVKHDLSDISAKVLSQRLRRLEADGLVARVPLSTSPPSIEYALTPLGHDLQPALAALVAVGQQIKRSKAIASGNRLAQLVIQSREVDDNIGGARVDAANSEFA